MATILLVHGAWQGAWCWDRLVPLLRSAGHQPVTVELTGGGARAGELTPDVDLTTHVADVEAAVRDVSEGEPIVLVTHSYSGMVAADVVERVLDRVGAVVLVDAFYPAPGESALDQMPHVFSDRFRARAADVGDGWRLPANEALLDVWGLHDPEDRRWVGSRLTDWSLRCFESPSAAASDAMRGLSRWYVSGVGDHPAAPAFQAIAARAADDGCTHVSISCGHDVQVERPADLAAVIDDAASVATTRR